MKRRDFLKTAGAGSAVVAGTLAAPAISQGREKNDHGDSVGSWARRGLGCVPNR